MDRGIYASASAGVFQLKKLELVNNNLANVNTPGFKKQLLSGEVQEFDKTLASSVASQDSYARGDHQRTPGVVNAQAVTDFSLGPIKSTSKLLDAALRQPKDFFVINTPGGVEYTRAGDFTLNGSGELVTQDGYPVQGDGGPITINGAGATITGDGSVLANGERVARLSVVRIEDPAKLERAGATRFRLAAGAGAPEEVEPDIEPQALEMSNVSAISSMIDLMASQRAFQAYTRTAESVDQLNQAAINQIGRSRG